jgi:hypothetical protein
MHYAKLTAARLIESLFIDLFLEGHTRSRPQRSFSGATKEITRLSLPLLAHCLSYRVAEADTLERNDGLV